MNIREERLNKITLYLTFGILIGDIFTIIFFAVAGSIFDYSGEHYWSNFRRALTFNFEGGPSGIRAGSALVYLLILILVIMWVVNWVLYGFNHKRIVDDNVMMLAFLFSCFFLFFVSFFMYIFVSFTTIRKMIDARKLVKIKPLQVPEKARFYYEKSLDDYNKKYGIVPNEAPEIVIPGNTNDLKKRRTVMQTIKLKLAKKSDKDSEVKKASDIESTIEVDISKTSEKGVLKIKKKN